MSVLNLLLLILAMAQSNDPLSQYIWKNRILIIHELEGDANVRATINAIDLTREEFVDRDMILVHLKPDEVRIDSKLSTDKEAAYLRSKYPADNKNRFILIGKDGGIKLDQYEKLNVLEVYQLIDSMPMRKSEMRKDNRN